MIRTSLRHLHRHIPQLQPKTYSVSASLTMYNLLIGGYGPHVSYVSFDPSTAKLKVHKESPTPKAPSWIDPSTPLPALKTADGGQAFYTISEVDDGIAISLELNGGEAKVTGKVKAFGSPAHSMFSVMFYVTGTGGLIPLVVHALKDGSGVITANVSVYLRPNPLELLTTSSEYLAERLSLISIWEATSFWCLPPHPMPSIRLRPYTPWRSPTSTKVPPHPIPIDRIRPTLIRSSRVPMTRS